MKPRQLYPLLVTAAAALILIMAIPRAGAQAPPSESRICAAPGLRFITGQTESEHFVPFFIPAGRHEVAVITQDGYVGRENSDPALQSSERVSVSIGASDAVLKASVTTEDLPDGVASAWLETIGEILIDVPADGFLVTHVDAGDGYDSVEVPLVCFTRLPEPVEPPITTVPPTTTPTTEPPAPEPTTPPTTEPPAPVQTTEPPAVEPPAEPAPEPEPVPVPIPEPVPCAGYPDNFVPSYDVNGDPINDLCQLPPGSCVEGESVLVPGALECQYLPENESG